MKRVDDLLKYLESYSDIAVVNKAKIHQELLLIKKEVAAINYTHSCEELKDKEETAFDLWLKNFKHAERDLYWYNKDTLYCVEAMRDIYNTEIKPTL